MDEISHLRYASLADLLVADMYRIDSRSAFPMISITCLYPNLFLHLFVGRKDRRHKMEMCLYCVATATNK